MRACQWPNPSRRCPHCEARCRYRHWRCIAPRAQRQGSIQCGASRLFGCACDYHDGCRSHCRFTCSHRAIRRRGSLRAGKTSNARSNEPIRDRRSAARAGRFRTRSNRSRARSHRRVRRDRYGSVSYVGRRLPEPVRRQIRPHQSAHGADGYAQCRRRMDRYREPTSRTEPDVFNGVLVRGGCDR